MRQPLHARIPRYALWGLSIVVTVYPLLFMIFTAIKTPAEFAWNFWLPPSAAGFTLDNLREVWTRYKFYVFFRNSVLVCAVSSTLTVCVATLAGYAFAKLRFPLSEAVFLLVLAVMFLPVFTYVIPLFIQMRGLRLTNTLANLVLVYVFFNLPSSVFIARGYFESLPSELVESGLMDGASQAVVFRRLMLPLAKPILSAILILSFVGNWGEYICVTVSNTKDTVKTIPAALSYFTSAMNVFWWYQMAALCIAVLPILAAYIAFNRMFIRGLTEGALKG